MFDNPVKIPGFGFAVVRRKLGKFSNTAPEYARAKLQPRRPTAADRPSDGSWPITARDWEILLPTGVSDDYQLPEILYSRYQQELREDRPELPVAHAPLRSSASPIGCSIALRPRFSAASFLMMSAASRRRDALMSARSWRCSPTVTPAGSRATSFASASAVARRSMSGARLRSVSGSPCKRLMA